MHSILSKNTTKIGLLKFCVDIEPRYLQEPKMFLNKNFVHKAHSLRSVRIFCKYDGFRKKKITWNLADKFQENPRLSYADFL